MRAYRAERAGKAGRFIGVVALLAGFGLSGCSDIDNAMFGTDEAGPAGGSGPGTLSSSAPAAPTRSPRRIIRPIPRTPSRRLGTMADQGAVAPASSGAIITPVQIEPGSNTGTGVSTTIANLRSQMVGITGHVGENAQRLAGLRAQNTQASTAYHEAKAHITARLQVGTTRGNPGTRGGMEFGAEPRSTRSRSTSTRSTRSAAISPTIPPPRISRSTRSRRPSTCPARSTRIIASFRCSRTRPTRPSC